MGVKLVEWGGGRMEVLVINRMEDGNLILIVHKSATEADVRSDIHVKWHTLSASVHSGSLKVSMK